MTKMTKEEIKEFLRNKRGYLKEGGKRLRNILNRKNFDVTIKDCKAATREVLQEIRINPTIGKSKARILFYDIETSYGIAKAWRPGFNIRLSYDAFIVHPKIICISYKWSDEDVVHTVQWDSKEDDKTLLEQFIPELNKADFIVAHNGDKFDLPWIKQRALVHGIPMYPKYTSVDTYVVAKRNFRFPSNKLNDIGEYLELGKKIKVDLELWDRIILNKEAKALEEMIAYCEQDVKLLEKIYIKFSEMLLPKVHVGVMNGEVKQSSPYTGGKSLELVKTTTTKAGTIKRLMKCQDTGKFFEMSNTDYRKYIEMSTN